MDDQQTRDHRSSLPSAGHRRRRAERRYGRHIECVAMIRYSAHWQDARGHLVIVRIDPVA
jgi:hypothetical protein